MVKKPKRTSKMLALLLAVVMTVGSVPTTAFAANSSSIGASSSSLEGLFRLWQPYGYRLLCRKRNHLLDSRICSLGRKCLIIQANNKKHLSGGAFFIYRQSVWGGGFPVCTGFAIRRRKYCASTRPDPRKSPCRAVFAGWSLGFFIDNMGAMRYYYKVSVCLFAGHTPENQV